MADYLSRSTELEYDEVNKDGGFENRIYYWEKQVTRKLGKGQQEDPVIQDALKQLQEGGATKGQL